MAPKARAPGRPAKPKKSKKPIGRPPAAARMEAAMVGKKDYDPDKMREARDLVRAGELKLAQAARDYAEYGVNYHTLRRHVQGKSSPSKRPGNQGKVSMEDQKAVSNWIHLGDRR
mmetsp:Transcript_23554/g.63853  ORF Transcript_23554/g.63853 Transcript_23554/m.63853 type:complete len:115 (-) Transcript_23554:346-690(-)